ncbi:murein biosynthesis integral membrane protein MurJ [Bacillus toyonensis]|uniref:murein biosynthesis integral membrane protein MurJ n=1 Tax=Bacillus toyonensis TaxID=155322 RepID=UPI000BFB30AB|nr:murein biosynthesis integral membrane protein MurJ [Bacillus toyonensis]PHF50619.1 murein biosynthesis integral membrane protein MurJ [Bacillus toyonensis]
MKSSFIKSTLIVIIFTFLSKVSGFGVDTLLAYTYGPSFYSDLYVFLISIVTLIFIAVGGAVSTTFSPILSELIVKGTKEEQNRFISNTLNVFLLLLIFMCIGCFSFAKQIIEILAPGFTTNYSLKELEIAINSVRIISLTLILIGIQSILVGILNCYKSFRAASSVSIYSNLTLIVFLFFFHNKLGQYGIVYAIGIGYGISIISLLPFIRKTGFNYKLYLNFKDKKFREMCKRVGPVFLGSSVLQINLIIDSMLASTIGPGSLSILNYASKLNVLITHVIGLAIATVAFPTLSELAAQNDKIKFTKVLKKVVNMTCIIIVPITLIIISLKEPIISLLFERGQFNYRDTLKTAEILLFYSPAMIFITLREVYNRAFYSLYDTKTPMIISILGVVINIVLKLVLLEYLSLAGIALATSISVVLVTILQMLYLNKKQIVMKGAIKVLLQVLILGLPMYIFVKNIHVILGEWVQGSNFIGKLFNIGVSSLLGIIIYGILLFTFKILDVKDIKLYFRKK